MEFDLNIVYNVASIIIAYVVCTQGIKAENKKEGQSMGEILAKLRTISDSVDSISKKQDAQGEQIMNIVAHVARLDERCNFMEKRIDRIEGRCDEVHDGR